jgi:hypothetical protein
MERFWSRNNVCGDDKFAAWCAEHPNGYVFNFFKGTDKQNDMNILHSASCSRLHARGTKASIEKVCSTDLSELEAFADQHRVVNRWRHCRGSDCLGSGG